MDRVRTVSLDEVAASANAALLSSTQTGAPDELGPEAPFLHGNGTSLGSGVADAWPSVFSEHLLPVTKFAPPKDGPNLRRPRLLGHFGQARLVLVCAGPGYGKTSLLRSAVFGTSDPWVWLSLDGHDRSSRQFVSGLLEATSIAAERAGEHQLAPRASSACDVDQARLACWVNTVARYPGRLLLILDDSHRVQSSPEVREALAYLLMYLPSNATLVLSTRVRPCLPSLDLLFARGHAVELTAADLRFTPAESLDLLVQYYGIDPGSVGLEELDRLCDGWPVGLQAWRQEALAHAGTLDGVSAHTVGTLPMIKNYLRAEVLDQQPPDVRKFLLESATLEYLDPETCDQVLGRLDSDLMLEHVEQQNLFVSRADSGKLRYQGFFRGYLRELLDLQPGHRRRLANAAATYFDSRGETASAIEKSLEAGECEAAALRMVRIAPTVFGLGLHERFGEWMGCLPEATIKAHPELLIRYGEVLSWQGQSEASARCFDRAMAAPSVDGVPPWLAAVGASGQALAAIARLEWRRSPGGLAGFYQRLLAAPAFAQAPTWPLVLSALALAALTEGRPAEADELLDRAVAACGLASDRGARELEVLNEAGFLVPFVQGRFARALEAARRAQALAERDNRPEHHCLALLHAGDVLVQMRRGGEAQHCAEQALAIARRLGLRLCHADALRLLGLCAGVESHDDALACYLEALGLLVPNSSADRLAEAHTRIDLSTLQRRTGQAAEAASHAQRALECLEAARPDAAWLEPSVWLALAAALVDREPLEAEQLLRHASAAFRSRQDQHGAACADYWLAVLALARSSEEFLVPLQSALTRVAQADGCERSFLEEPARSVPLLTAALARLARSGSACHPPLSLVPIGPVHIPDGIPGAPRGCVCDLLIRLGAPAVDALVHLLDRQDVELRRRVVFILGKIGDPRARRSLLRFLKGDERCLREPTRAALARLGVPAPAQLRIQLLGRFCVTRLGEPVADRAWKTRKVKMLFKYLVVHKGRFIPQEQLMDLLWPDADPRAASMNLRTTLRLLRLALEPGLEGTASHFIQHRGEAILFQTESPYWLDTEEFLDRYNQGRTYESGGQLDQAVAEYEAADRLYAGAFLGEDVYEDWTLADRERFQQRHSELLLRLADIRTNRGELEEAIGLCQRVLVEDELREDVYRRLMILHRKAGRPVSAIQQYRACRSSLSSELGVEPAVETRQLFEQIQRDLDAGKRKPQAYFTANSRSPS